VTREGAADVLLQHAPAAAGVLRDQSLIVAAARPTQSAVSITAPAAAEPAAGPDAESGGTFYREAFQSDNVVYVVSKP
jgi:hypothetical protein